MCCWLSNVCVFVCGAVLDKWGLAIVAKLRNARSFQMWRVRATFRGGSRLVAKSASEKRTNPKKEGKAAPKKKASTTGRG